MNDYLAKIIDAANEGIYVTDRDRRFLLWNETAERVTGYRKEEIIGRCCHDNILQHTDREGIALCFTRCPLLAAVEDGAPHGPEIVYLRHKNGTRIPVEVKTAAIRSDEGRVIGGVEIFMDVTERLEQERLLRERKEKLEAVLDSIGDGILFLDTAGNLAVFNHACAEIFGIEKLSPGSSIHSLPETAPLRQAFSLMEGAYKLARLPEKEGVVAGCTKQGGLFRCWTEGVDRSPTGPRSSCCGCAKYRYARSFLEKPRELTWGERTFTVVSSFIELRETNELWEVIVFHDVTAEKLDAALKVAGAAAHELRQPLQAIVILAGLAGEDQHDHAALDKHLESILTSCDRMDLIIQRMAEIIRYRTKDYVDGRQILDIEQSSDKT